MEVTTTKVTITKTPPFRTMPCLGKAVATAVAFSACSVGRFEERGVKGVGRGSSWRSLCHQV